jgi:hypothetical protein
MDSKARSGLLGSRDFPDQRFRVNCYEWALCGLAIFRQALFS